jgi:hypothetical protein
VVAGTAIMDEIKISRKGRFSNVPKIEKRSLLITKRVILGERIRHHNGQDAI